MARVRDPYQLVGKSNEYDVRTAKDLMIQAGLNWTVSLNDVYTSGTYDQIQIEDKFATVKTDISGKETVLSVVGSRYKVFQNAEIFSCLDDIVDSGQISYGAAGELKDGKVVWATLELPEDVNVGDDKHNAYILARTSHDGSTPFQLTPMINRLGCTNQINARMFAGKEAGIYYSMRHSTNSVINVQDIWDSLKIIRKDVERYVTVSTWLRGQSMDDNEFNNFIKRVYPLPSKIEFSPEDMLSAGEKRAKTRAHANRRSAISVWLNETDTQHSLYRTKFGAFQAVVENFDHNGRNSYKQAEKIIAGSDIAIKSRALELLGVS